MFKYKKITLLARIQVCWIRKHKDWQKIKGSDHQTSIDKWMLKRIGYTVFQIDPTCLAIHKVKIVEKFLNYKIFKNKESIYYQKQRIFELENKKVVILIKIGAGNLIRRFLTQKRKKSC